MGRPKGSKNKVKKQNLFDLETTVKIQKSKVEEPKPIKKVKEIKINCTCDVCGSKIYCSPVRVDIGNLTGMANWHRECSKDKFNLCQNCSKEFNEYVDKWFIHKNPELMKFKMNQLKEYD